MRENHSSGKNEAAPRPTARIIRRIQTRRLVYHQKARTMAPKASKAPREWLPSDAATHISIEKAIASLPHFELICDIRKYMSGTMTTKASANSLLPSMKVVGGPQTR